MFRRLGIGFSAPQKSRRHNRRPCLVFLEDRLAPAVTTLNDSLAGFLRITPEDTETTVSLISVTDADNPAGMSVRIFTTGGATRIATLGSATVGNGSNGANDYTLTGSISDVNAALATLRFTPALNQNSSTVGFNPSIDITATDVTNSGTPVSLTVRPFAVTQVNDPPDLSTAVPLIVSEGANASMSRAQLASSDNNLDPDIATGQQVVDQQMVEINSLPAKGTLSYKGGVVTVGSVIPVSNLSGLRYTHTAGDIPNPDTDSFNVTVSDGGGGATNGIISVTIMPVNVPPSVSGSPSIIEGQVKVVVPAISLGDSFDTLANSTIVIDTIVTGNQGDFFIDSNNNNIVDTGEALTGSVTLSPSQRSSLSTQFKFRHNGAEPNAPTGVSTPSYRISVTDAGGGTGTPAGPVTATMLLTVIPNNDDPTLTNLHSTPGSALVVGETSTTTILTGMLKIDDVDRNPADPSTTTPVAQLVYTIISRPTQGELQLEVKGNWLVLGDGARFTQVDIDNSRLRYQQTTAAIGQTPDSFTFLVRDSSFGFDVWNNPVNPTSPREGGLRNDPKDATLAPQTFNLSITPLPTGNSGGTSPRDPDPGYGPPTYAFTGLGTDRGDASWKEDNLGTADGGYVITQAMLNYVITRSSSGVSVIISPAETVYTLVDFAPNGTLQRLFNGNWQAIAYLEQFTQADINTSKIRFVHDGGEDHYATFGYRVSDGTENFQAATFTIDVIPINDRPGAGGGSAQVTEGNGNTVRLTTAAIGMSDGDGSLDGKTGEGLADFLWFMVTGLAVDGAGTARGDLERWDGSAWVLVTTTEWLPSTLLSATADSGTSGLRYRHDGSEPLAYTGGAKVSFTYVVRDDLANPANAFATNTTTPSDTSGSAQSNQSPTGTTTINIVPVNNAPVIADKPSDADPTIGGTITNGGVLTGKNDLLAGVPGGAIVTITSAHLTAIDQDSTTTQRQFRIKSTPSQGILLLSGKILGVDSTFTQADIDSGKVQYSHLGVETVASTTDALGTYDDKFHFVVDDAVLQDTGADSPNFNTFLITVAPSNRAPEVTAPLSAIAIDSTTPARNPVAGFSIADPDLTNGFISGETDFVQVTVRLLDAVTGVPFTDYAAGFAGGGVSFEYATQSGGLWAVTKSGTHEILQFQGTRTQVNAALAGLTVTFANDFDSAIKLEVIADDRIRNFSGALDSSGSDANGGELNEGGIAVPSTVYDWSSTTTVPAMSQNITSATVTLRVSSVNDPATFTGPAGTATIDEDTRTRITGPFVVADPESAAFGTPVTVTISVPAGQGTVDVAGSGAQTTFTPAGGQAIAISGDYTRALTMTGRAADIQALLNQRNFLDNANDTAGGLFYTSASNANHDANGTDAGDVTITLAFDDAGSRFGGDVGSGSVANNPANLTIPVSITPVNDAAVVNRTAATVPISGTSPVAVSGFSITDVDSNDGYSPGETDFIQALVRLLDASGNPVSAATYSSIGFTIDTTAASHGATIDTTFSGSQKALKISGSLTQVNAYLAGLRVTFASLANSNIDLSYSLEVIADDRLRDGSGTLTGGANGGANNQQANLPVVPSTDTFDVYSTKIATYAIYNVTSNTRPLFVSSINDPGSITANNVTLNEGSATLTLNSTNGNISIADPDDNGASTLTATVTVSAGTISAVGGSGGTVSGTGTATVTITGTETQLNSRLQGLTITFPDPDGAGPATAANWNGAFTVNVVYRDDANTGTRPSTLAGDTNAPAANPGDFDYEDVSSNVLLTTRRITVTLSSVNNAPIRTDANPATLLAVIEDVAGGTGTSPPGETIANLFSAKFSDALDTFSPNAFAGVAITANNASPAQGIWQYSTDGNSWTALPTVSTASALLLKTADFLRFVPAANYHGTPGGLVVRLVDDSGGALTTASTANVSTNSGGTTRISDSNNAVTLNTTVTNVNDRPAGANTTLAAINEDDTNPPGATVATLGFGYTDIIDNQTGITGGGTAATAFGGIAIVGNAANSSTQGTWQYSTTPGTWVTIGSSGSAPTDATAIILPTGASLRFLPNANYNGTPGSLTARVADSARAFSSSTDISANLTATDIWSSTVTLGTSVNKRNDTPTLTHTATNPSVTENSSTAGAVSIDPVNLLTPGTVSDIDLSTTLGLGTSTFGAGTITATLTNGISGDSLILNPSLTLPTGVSVSGGSASSPFIITLAQATSISSVQALLEAIQYRHIGDDPTAGGTNSSRGYTIVLADGNNAQSGGNAGGPASLNAATISGTITITAVNDKPIVTAGGNLTYTENGSPAVIDASITILDPDDTQIASASVAISSGFLSGDTLSFTTQNGISGNYNSSTGIMSLTGSATPSQYQAALRTVKYSSTSEDPTNNDTIANRTRTVSWTVTDGNASGVGAQSSSTVSSGITVIAVNDRPVITAGATMFYTEGGPAAAIDGTITITDLDDTQLAGATVRILSGFTTGDILGFINQNGISGTYDGSTGLLSLTGLGTLTQYRDALRSVTYRSTSMNVTGISASRTVSWTLTDANSDNVGAQTSVAVSSTINITAVNDPPSLAPVTITYADTPANDTFANNTGTLTFSDPEGDTLTFGIQGGAVSSGNVSITGTNGTLDITTATGAYIFTPNDYNGIVTNASESFTITASDGISTTTALFTVNIIAVNDPGTVTANDVTVNEGSATISLNATNGNISIADPDDNGASTLTATVIVGAGTISAVGASGGSVSGTGTATITITGTEAQLNSRLQALTITFPDPDGAGTATAANWNRSFPVTVVYRDAGNTGSRPGYLDGDNNDPTANPGDFAYENGASNVLITTRVISVTVNPRNNAPAFTHTAVNPTVKESITASKTVTIDPVSLLNKGAVSDIDLTTTTGLSPTVFGAGKITVNLTNGITGDTLFLKASPSLPAVQAIVGGTGSTPFEISLNQGTTLSQVKALLEAIQFSHSGGQPTGLDSTRAYTVVLNDGNNLQSGGNAGGPMSINSPTLNGTITIQRAPSAWLEPWAAPFFMANFAASTAPPIGPSNPLNPPRLFNNGSNTNLAGLTYLITFSDPIKNLERNAINLTNQAGTVVTGRIKSLFNIPGTDFKRWRLDITPNLSGTQETELFVKVRSGMYRNEAGKTGGESNTVSAHVFRDLGIKASMVCASGSPPLGNTFGTTVTSINLTLTLTRPVDATTVNSNAFKVTNAVVGSITPVTGMSATYSVTLDVANSSTGSIKVQFTGTGVRDEYGNRALASGLLAWRRDITGPSLLPSSKPLSIRFNQQVSVAVKFTEALIWPQNQLNPAIFEVVDASSGNSMGSAITVSRSGSSYTVKFNATARGTWHLRLKSTITGPPTDLLGNPLMATGSVIVVNVV